MTNWLSKTAGKWPLMRGSRLSSLLRIVRLIDLIAQTRRPFIVERDFPPRQFRLRGALDLAPLVTACPARYILSDDVTRTCAELAFSCGDQLANCLDLVRVPAPSMWLEWSNSAALEGAADFFEKDVALDVRADRRVGLYIQGEPTGQLARVHSFWSEAGEALVCPNDAVLDFRGEQAFEENCFAGNDWIEVIDPDPAVGRLLECARFRMEDSWAGYYASAAISTQDRWRVVRDTLGTIARDVPLLLAFLLLLASRDGVTFHPVSRDAINRKRARHGHAPLINHLEVSLALRQKSACTPYPSDGDGGRLGPRRHHVRGHLVRRRNRIFWRRPHVRGNVLRGRVLSRTVTLEIGRATVP